MMFCDRFSLLCTKSVELANYLGCTVQAVNQYKNGTAFPKVENLIKIAEYYGVSLDYLVGLSDCKLRNPSAEKMHEQIQQLVCLLSQIEIDLSNVTGKIKDAVEFLRSVS